MNPYRHRFFCLFLQRVARASFKLTRLMALLFFAVTLMARECVIEVS
jgi:hypothetical protein